MSMRGGAELGGSSQLAPHSQVLVELHVPVTCQEIETRGICAVPCVRCQVQPQLLQQNMCGAKQMLRALATLGNRSLPFRAALPAMADYDPSKQSTLQLQAGLVRHVVMKVHGHWGLCAHTSAAPTQRSTAHDSWPFGDMTLHARLPVQRAIHAVTDAGARKCHLSPGTFSQPACANTYVCPSPPSSPTLGPPGLPSGRPGWPHSRGAPRGAAVMLLLTAGGSERHVGPDMSSHPACTRMLVLHPPTPPPGLPSGRPGWPHGCSALRGAAVPLLLTAGGSDFHLGSGISLHPACIQTRVCLSTLPGLPSRQPDWPAGRGAPPDAAVTLLLATQGGKGCRHLLRSRRGHHLCIAGSQGHAVRMCTSLSVF